MALKLVFNPFTGTFDWVEMIPQLNADPVAPAPQSAWVRRTSIGGGELKFLFGGGTAITDAGTPIYELSYRTLQGTTKRVALT